MVEKLTNISPGSFRFGLSLIVMIFHSVSFISFGHFPVYIFFILSGYWIWKIFIEKYSVYESVYFTYLISRFLRLYPVYIIILIFSIIFYQIIGYVPKPNSCTMLNNTLIVFNEILGGEWILVPSWSLAIELQFYIIAPLFIAKRNTNFLIGLFIFFSFFSVFSVVYDLEIIKKTSILVFLPYFILGGCVYECKLFVSDRVAKYSILSVFFLILVSHLIPTLRNTLLNSNFTIFNFSLSEIFNLLLTLTILPFFVYNVKYPTVNKNNDKILSSMSYTLYLIHWPFLQLYSSSVDNISMLQKCFHLLVYYSSCIFISFIISKYIDLYLERNRIKWLSRQSIG